MLTEKEYRLMRKIRDEGEKFDPCKLSREEKNTFGVLMDKGYVVCYQRSEQCEKHFQNSEVMLHKDAGGKADDAEKQIEPELEPRTPGILTPTILSRLLLSGLLSFVMGALFCFVFEHVFVL